MPEKDGPLPTTFAEFMGEFREYKRASLDRLDRIEERLAEGNDKFTAIEVRCAQHTMSNTQLQNDLTAVTGRVDAIESDGPQLTLRRRVQMDGTTLITIVQLILTALTGVKLPT